MDDIMLTLQALVIAAAAIGFFSLCFFAGAAFYMYAKGRKRGGYPLFAKIRRKTTDYAFLDDAYIVGLRQAQKKLENGGYK